MRTVLCLTILISAANLTAAGASTDDESIAAAVARLDSDDFDARKKAFSELCDRGESVVPQLKRALSTGLSNEQKSVAIRVIDLMAGGEVVDGLRMELACDKAAIETGQSVTFTIRVKNATAHPVYLFRGDSNYNDALATGECINMGLSGEEKSAAEIKSALEGPSYNGPMHDLIPAYGIKEYALTGKLAVDDEAGRCLAIKKGANVYLLKAAKNGTYVASVSFKPSDSMDPPMQPDPPLDPKIPVCRRALASNSIELKISDAGK